MLHLHLILLLNQYLKVLLMRLHLHLLWPLQHRAREWVCRGVRLSCKCHAVRSGVFLPRGDARARHTLHDARKLRRGGAERRAPLRVECDNSCGEWWHVLFKWPRDCGYFH